MCWAKQPIHCVSISLKIHWEIPKIESWKQCLHHKFTFSQILCIFDIQHNPWFDWYCGCIFDITFYVPKIHIIITNVISLKKFCSSNGIEHYELAIVRISLIIYLDLKSSSKDNEFISYPWIPSEANIIDLNNTE